MKTVLSRQWGGRSVINAIKLYALATVTIGIHAVSGPILIASPPFPQQPTAFVGLLFVFIASPSTSSNLAIVLTSLVGGRVC